MLLLLTRPKNTKDCTKNKAEIQLIVQLQPSKRSISIPSSTLKAVPQKDQQKYESFQ